MNRFDAKYRGYDGFVYGTRGTEWYRVVTLKGKKIIRTRELELKHAGLIREEGRLELWSVSPQEEVVKITDLERLS
jgi:hypothetical protein